MGCYKEPGCKMMTDVDCESRSYDESNSQIIRVR